MEPNAGNGEEAKRGDGHFMTMKSLACSSDNSYYNEKDGKYLNNQAGGDDQFITIPLEPNDQGAHPISGRLSHRNDNNNNEDRKQSTPTNDFINPISSTNKVLSKSSSFNLRTSSNNNNTYTKSKTPVKPIPSSIINSFDVSKNSIESINSKQSDSEDISDQTISRTQTPSSFSNKQLNKSSGYYKVIGTRRVEPPRINEDTNISDRAGIENNLTSSSNKPTTTTNSIEHPRKEPNDKDNNNYNSDIVRFSKDHDTNRNSVSSCGSGVAPGHGQPSKKLSGAALRRASMVKKPPFPFAGILIPLISSVFFSASALLIKFLPDSDEGTGLQEKIKACMFRGIIIGSLCAISNTVTKTTFKVKRDELWVNLSRALTGTMANASMYISFEYISLGDATALIFSSPIWTYLLSHFIFGEPLSWTMFLVMPLSVVGIILISHPTLIVPESQLSLNHGNEHKASSQNETTTTTTASSTTLNMEDLMPTGDHLDERWRGIVIALIGSVLVSFTYITLKFSKETPIQTTTFWTAIVSIIFSVISMSIIGFGQMPDTIQELACLLGTGVLSWLGQTLLQSAFAYEDAGVISIVRTNDVVMSFIFSAIFLDDDIYWTSILGSTILVLVLVLIIVNSWIQKACCPASNDDDIDITSPNIQCHRPSDAIKSIQRNDLPYVIKSANLNKNLNREEKS